MASILNRNSKVMGAPKVYTFLDIVGRGSRNSIYRQTSLSTRAGAWSVYITCFIGDCGIFEVNLVDGT